MNENIRRIITNEILTNAPMCGTMEVLQADEPLNITVETDTFAFNPFLY
jgi:hypothetical protein